MPSVPPPSTSCANTLGTQPYCSVLFAWALHQKFNFRPESDDVGNKLVVEKVIIGMGQSNSGMKMNLHQIIPEEKFGRPPYEKDFPSFRARK